MKRTAVCLALLLTSLVATAESPCVECLKAAQLSLATCQNNAKTEAEKKQCVTKGQDAIASCNRGVCKK